MQLSFVTPVRPPTAGLKSFLYPHHGKDINLGEVGPAQAVGDQDEDGTIVTLTS